MPFLVVGGVTVDVARYRWKDVPVGDGAPMFDGSYRQTYRSHKARYEVGTVPMATAAASTLLAVLTGAQPVACSGDGIASANFFVEDVAYDTEYGAGAALYAIAFSLRSAT